MTDLQVLLISAFKMHSSCIALNHHSQCKLYGVYCVTVLSLHIYFFSKLFVALALSLNP